MPSPLNDLTYFNNRSMGGVDASEMNSQRAQDMLAALRKYDPSAMFAETSIGESGQKGYTLNFDATKLPGVNGSGQLGQGQTGVGTGATFMPRFSTVQDQMQLARPGAVTDSPVYGKITSNKNIMQPHSMLDTLGPLLVSAFGMGAPALFGSMGLGMGAGASAAIGGAQGGLAASQGGMGGLGAGSSLGSAAGNLAVGTARDLGSGRGFNPLSLIPLAGIGLGLPSWATSGITTLGKLAGGGKVPRIGGK